MSKHCLFALLLLALLLPSCWTGCKVNEDTLIEKPLGQLAKLGIEAQYDMIRDPLLYDYVKRIGQTQVDLAARRQKVPYHFHVVNTNEVNAFAIPWGGVYMTYGLLNAAETEDELAAVMGHEIGHVEGRHAVRSVKKQLWGNVLLSLLKGNVSDDTMTALRVAGMFISLKYSRDQEYDADRRGVEMAYKSYYDPYGEVVFFERLRELYGDEPRFLSYLSTHPLHRDRIARAQKRPELSEQNATPLSRIATGYARRGMYAPALAHFEQALKVDPRYVPAYLGLAQAAAARGETRRAVQAYQTALRYDDGNQEVRNELGALESRPAERPAPVPSNANLPTLVAAARASNEQLLRSLQAENQEIEGAMKRAQRDDKQVRQSMETTATLLQELQAVEDRSGAMEQLIGYGYKVINLANDAVSILGFAREETAATVEQLLQTHQALARFLEQPLQTATDAELAQRLPAMTRLTQAALDELREAVSEIGASQDRIQRANFGAADAIQNLHRTFYVQGSPRREAFDFRYALEDAERGTRDALERAQGIARAAAAGHARTYQLSIDALLAGATPAQQQVASGLIQHFLIVPAEEVLSLRHSGHSFGEASLLLAGARSEKQDPAELKGPQVSYTNLVDSLKNRRVRLDYLNVMLKFLTNALESEMDEASYQENARTWAMET